MNVHKYSLSITNKTTMVIPYKGRVWGTVNSECIKAVQTPDIDELL